MTSDKTGGANYDANGFNTYFGYGRINACEAVKKALEMGGRNVSSIDCASDAPIDTSDTGNTEPPADTADSGDTEVPADTGDTAAPSDTGDTGSGIKTKSSGCSASII